MKIKRLLVKVPVDTEDVIRKKEKSTIEINNNVKDIEIKINIDIIGYVLHITITETDHTIVNYKKLFNSPFKIFTVLPIYNEDKSILYLLKIDVDSNNLEDSFYWNRRFSTKIERYRDFDIYNDIMYTNFLDNDELTKLCLKIVSMPLNENTDWQYAFYSKIQYMGYDNIYVGKNYTMESLKKMRTDTKNNIALKMLMLALVFICIRTDLDRIEFGRFKGMVYETYSKYTDLL